MKYTEFTKDQQTQLLKSRIAGWEADHFGHQINLMAFEGVRDPQGIETTHEALNVLEVSVNAGRKMLADLGDEEPAPNPAPEPETPPSG